MLAADAVASSPASAPAIAVSQPPPTPYTVIIDTREQRPFAFAEPLREGKKFFRVAAVRATLKSGDYSLAGFETQVAVERKSLNDLFNTLGQGRNRFTAELTRLNDMQYAAVVIEADWQAILTKPPARSQLKPLTVFASVIAWQQRFPRIHWWPCPDRDTAEAVTVRILERFWKDQGRPVIHHETRRM